MKRGGSRVWGTEKKDLTTGREEEERLGNEEESYDFGERGKVRRES